MELATETRERIFTAAETLYETAGRASFPTVDAVRKLAKVNMNDANAGMKEWRRAKTTQAAPVAVQVPEAVQQANNAALGVMWQQAMDLANQSLIAAQAGWDSERLESETLNRQMADAYEAQAVELQAAQGQIGTLEGEVTRLKQSLERLAADLVMANASAEREVAKAVEISRRADDLRVELDAAHRANDGLQEELKLVRDRLAAADAQAGDLRAKLAVSDAGLAAAKQVAQDERKKAEKALTEREESHAKAGAAKEEAAKLRGQIETLQSQAQEAGAAREDAANLRGQLQALQSKISDSAESGKSPAEGGASSSRKKG